MTSDLAAVPALYWFWVIVSERLYSTTVFVRRSSSEFGLPKLHVGERQRRLLCEQGVGETGRCALRSGLLRLDLAPHLSPDVEHPLARRLGGETRRIRRTVDRGGIAVDGRKKSGARLVDESERFTIVRFVSFDGLIGNLD